LRIVISLFILWGVVLSASCQANAVGAGATLEVTTSPIAAHVSPASGEPQMTPSLPIDAGLQNLIDKAISDLANRLSIPSVEITVVEATPIVWPDSSLGCPQPGMEYLQVPEDGLLIRLQANEQIYEYHSGGFRDPFLCETIYKDPNPLPKIDFFNLTPSSSTTPDNSIPPGEDK
jgi:hypothetical protein